MNGAKLAFAGVLVASTGAAQVAPQAPVTGWWRAELHHGGEVQPIYLHFKERDGKLIVSFSNPEIDIAETGIGLASLGKDSVDIAGIGWTLKRDGEALTGVIPDALVAVYRMDARFVRSPPPQPVEPQAPARPGPKPLWQGSVAGPVFGGLAFDAVGQRVVAATDAGNVVALGATDGRTIWSVNGGAAIRATPVIGADAIFVATDVALLKLDRSTGRRLWTASLGTAKAPRLPTTDPKSRFEHYTSSPVLAGSSVYAGSRDGCVYRFKVASGAPITRYCATDMITGTPVVDGSRLYFASFDKSVYAANLNGGQILWKRDVQGAVPRDLVLSGRNLLAGSRSFDLVALDKDTGKPSWTNYYWFSWVDAVPNVVGHTIYVGSSDRLRVFALDGTTGRTRWASRVPGWSWAKPAVGRTAVYASITGTTMPYAGARAGGFAAIDKDSGKLRWLLSSDKPDGQPVYGFASAPVLANGIVYAADLAGHVLAFKDE